MSADESKSDSQRDPMGPPEVPCECYCLHCGRTFLSDKIWFQKIVGHPKMDGFWMCPTPNCDGAGFCFDIYPCDEEIAAEHGVHYSNADDEFDDDFEDEDEFEDDEEFEDEDIDPLVLQPDVPADEYDPSESHYRELDDRLGDGEDDLIEGDEWKLGVSPDEPVPPQMYWPESQRRRWEEEQKKYDGPDLRPRELDWSDREYSEQDFKEDDIPF